MIFQFGNCSLANLADASVDAKFRFYLCRVIQTNKQGSKVRFFYKTIILNLNPDFI